MTSAKIRLYNNASESVNAVMKRWQNFQLKDVSTFIDDLKELVEKQRRDVQRVFLGLHSPYTVRPEYQHHVQTGAVLEVIAKERQGIINSVKALVDLLRYKQVVSYRSTPMLPHDVSKGKSRKVKSESALVLSPGKFVHTPLLWLIATRT